MSDPAGSALAGYRALLDALPAAVLVADDEGHVLIANARASELLGRPPEGALLPDLLAGPGGPAAHTEPADLDGISTTVVTLHAAGHEGHVETAQRLATIVQSSTDAILTTDMHGTLTSWNPGAERMYGYTAQEALGRPVSIIIGEDHKDEMEFVLSHIRRGEPIEHFETVRVAKGGRRREVSISVAPVRDARGAVVAVATVARDISEQRRADDRVRALVESAPDAVVVVDEAGRIVLVNRQTEELFGHVREDLLGGAVERLFPERLREPDSYGFGYFADPGRGGAALELIGVRADGIEFPIEVTFSPLSTDAGLLVYAAIRDITERKAMDEELRRSNHDLEQFAYVASHDLSEPLRVIAGFVDLLARRYRGQLDEDADRFIDFIISGVERMQVLIDDLLAYSRAGRARIAPRPLDTAEVVRDVIWALEPTLQEKGASIEVGELPTVRAEKALIRQVFQNLIANAVKFADAEPPRVRVSARRVPGAWRFDVEDNGPGVDPRHAERIFEMFQRLHGREVAGSGMGLAIVKRLVERHGGKVWVAPAPSGGSVFSFTLPDRASDR